MVTLQIALALVLLIGAGLMFNSFVRVQNKDLGADPKGVLRFDFRFPQGETIKPFGRYRGVGLWDVMPVTTLTFQRVFERVQGMPGVVSAAAISRPPPTGGGINMPFLIQGRPAPPPSSASGDSSQEQGQAADYFAVTPNLNPHSSSIAGSVYKTNSGDVLIAEVLRSKDAGLELISNA